MRLVFAGTPEVAVPSLQALLESGHEILAVVTRPDAAAGRGKRLRPSPVREVAEAAGIEVLTPATPSEPEFVSRMRDLAPDAAPVVAFGGLIPPEVLSIPTHGWVNLHFSLLPAWRGAAPVQQAIIAGDTVTGASTFLLEEGLDTGPVIDTLTTQIGEHETSGELLERLAQEGAVLLVSCLDAIEAGTATPVPQPEEGVSYATKLSHEDARLDWSVSAIDLDRRARGCTPTPGAWTLFRGVRLRVGQMQVAAPGAVEIPEGAEPGRLVVSKRSVHVVTGDGVVELQRVQPAGKKMMVASDWARGVRIEDGELVGR
ncbi:methionyl-tRNA formyltransferase [Dermatophilus congolensis]|uniref:methionyl-tRNA formyltransferase n=1 Tax=Dermatophilus congolensis TaxID=1863 RepID=UPI001AB01904|nr:methionyl-tRNA formyltransferase [Dermatophilus congolensis]MBO3142441.1 methionyl-tRNA formyltransferase [Dermatophilus congolensis]MBO3151430.1 methionyl-tRNA formyltransferase [Dermatophilus congolensis]MBO3161566.1 methionyl-tRNA formyltransferase [Dermatophilus congolensis]MBO3162716.1 methionyl-tRNA formyltransferase [Dermatophilus congolensis]MBO3176270.1 methionyl-tRNA formyltransferase [Dermatophilus congolensis]